MHQSSVKDQSSGASRWAVGLALIILAVGVVRVVSTYSVFNQTWDEPAHLAAGMEWWDRGAYTYEPLHPPLARISVALAPYLSGLRSARYPDVWIEGNAILHTAGAYDRNLALARAGVLPFFVLAGLVVFAWTRRLFGNGAAVVAVLLFATLPPVLAHAGIATTDLAITATFALAAYAGLLWLERPTAWRSLTLGGAVALALLSKLSALLFLPAAAVAFVACRRPAAGKPVPPDPTPRTRRTRAVRIAYVCGLLVVWAGYRFSLGPLVPPDPPPAGIRAPLERAAYAVAQAPIYPAPELFQGAGQLVAKNRAGQKAYLLGEVRTTGWWYFFPVALAVKTPIAFLLLVAAGTLLVLRTSRDVARWRRLEPVAIALAVLLVCLPSRINIGLRHILPIYPLLAIVAGYGAVALWRAGRGRPAGPLLAGLLLAWQLVASARAHPDYLADFNELATRHPERILVDSDLDSGQDLKRLADTLRARGISEVALAYAGSATVRAHGLPSVRWLVPHRPDTGWIAASLYSLKLGSLDRSGHDDFAWLEQYDPLALAGRSIRLYYIPGCGAPAQGSATDSSALRRDCS